MAKSKKKTVAADNVRWKRAQAHKNFAEKEVRKNPFEVHINKQKHKILGRKSKHDLGLPGVSRSKAIKKRKETLLVEYKNREKNTVYKDARFAEKDMTISVEDKMLERYAIEHKKKHKKIDIYNLTNTEELTHMGQSLSDAVLTDRVENDTTYSDEEEPFQQFGGMFTRKHNLESEERQNVIDEIIANSKKEKYEQQVAKDKSEELCEKLDNTWSDVKSLLVSSFRTQEDKYNTRMNTKQDNYDLTVRQMMFDRKGAPSFRAKSKAEIENERKEELAKAQMERLARMSAPTLDKPTPKSADQLCMLEKAELETIRPIIYDKDGKMIMNEKGECDQNTKNEDEGLIGFKQGSNADKEGSDLNEEESSSGEEEDDDENDGFSDIEEEQSFAHTSSNLTSKFLNVKKKIKPVISKGLFAKNDESLLKLLFKCPSGDIKTCCSEMLTAAGSSKNDIAKVFRVLWMFAHDLASSGNIADVDNIVSTLYATASGNESAMFVQSRLKLLYSEEKALPVLPTLGNMIELKLIKLIWSTSDFKHPVVTSALVYIGHVIHLLRARSLQQAGIVLVMSTLAYDYVSFSRRFVPEAILSLNQLLYSLLPKKCIQKFKTSHEMSLFLPQYSQQLLHCEEQEIKGKDWNTNIFQVLTNISDDDNSNGLKITLSMLALQLMHKFINLYADMSTFPTIFGHTSYILSQIKTINSLPQVVSMLAHATFERFKTVCENLPAMEYLTLLTSKRPKMLKMLDPEFDEHVGDPFQRGSNKATSRVKKEQDRLAHKYRREVKGAVREIRKDAKFLATEKLNEQLAQDAERAAKVKRLYGLLANQEGDVKRMQRKKFKLDLS